MCSRPSCRSTACLPRRGKSIGQPVRSLQQRRRPPWRIRPLPSVGIQPRVARPGRMIDSQAFRIRSSSATFFTAMPTTIPRISCVGRWMRCTSRRVPTRVSCSSTTISWSRPTSVASATMSRTLPFGRRNLSRSCQTTALTAWRGPGIRDLRMASASRGSRTRRSRSSSSATRQASSAW